MSLHASNISPEAARASLYRLFALAFAYPSPQLHKALCDGDFQDAVRRLQDVLAVARTEFPAVRCDHVQMESAYIQLFEIGRHGEPACALRESAYVECNTQARDAPGSEDRTVLLEDLLRFYHHFGLRMTDVAANRELPDHLSCELEMLSFLCLRESLAEPGHESARWYHSAQRDFLRRHMSSWVPRFAEALRQRQQGDEAALFYKTLANAAAVSIAAHAERHS